MIRSMTAFARKDDQQEWGGLTWEIRTVNHRYLEPHFRLPEMMRALEPQLREKLGARLKRGKVECQLRIQETAAQQGGLQIDISMVEAINDAANQVNRILDNPAHLNALEILNWPGVMIATQQDPDAQKSAVLQLFEQALDDVLETREGEGKRLVPFLEQRLTSIAEIVTEVRAHLPGILQKQKENLVTRFEEARLELDAERVEQEMVLLAQKSDVAEELDRLDAHVSEVRSVISKGGVVGRRLDFLMQELNREANTLSSKSIVTETTRAAVELKVLIEQLREQIQNIE